MIKIISSGRCVTPFKRSGRFRAFRATWKCELIEYSLSLLQELCALASAMLGYTFITGMHHFVFAAYGNADSFYWIYSLFSAWNIFKSKKKCKIELGVCILMRDFIIKCLSESRNQKRNLISAEGNDVIKVFIDAYKCTPVKIVS